MLGPRTKKRPTFDQILSELQNNEGFITELVEKEDFLDYIDYVDNYKTTFGKDPIQIDQYIKRKSTTFTKVLINPKFICFDNINFSKQINKTKRHSLFKKNKNKILYPLHEIDNLDTKNRQLVEESAGDPNKEFKIGQFLIEGKEGFPQNAEIGLSYLDHSVKGGSIEATIYYSRLLIKGEIIPRDIEKAKKLLKKFKKANNGSILFFREKSRKSKKIIQKHSNISRSLQN